MYFEEDAGVSSNMGSLELKSLMAAAKTACG